MKHLLIFVLLLMSTYAQSQSFTSEGLDLAGLGTTEYKVTVNRIHLFNEIHVTEYNSLDIVHDPYVLKRGGSIVILDTIVELDLDEYVNLQDTIVIPKSSTQYRIAAIQPIYGHESQLEYIKNSPVEHHVVDKEEHEDLTLLAVEYYLEDNSKITVFSDGSIVHMITIIRKIDGELIVFNDFNNLIWN